MEHGLPDIFVFYVSVLCFQIFTKTIKFKAQKWSDLCNLYDKVIFGMFLSKKICFAFLL